MLADPRLRRPNGFSFVQLLVVLAILAVLLLLLLPAFQKARQQATSARCLSNLRQLGVASHAFLADHNGRLFPSMFWYNASNHPTDPGLRDYLGLQSSTPLGDVPDSPFTCPLLVGKFTHTGADRFKRTYSLNFYGHATNIRRRNDPNPDIRNALQFPGLLRRIAYPAQMWMFTDGGCAVVPAANFMTYITPDDNGIDYTFAPHNGRQLAVFFDGHAAPMEMSLFRKTRPANAAQAYDAFWGTLQK